MRIKALIKSFSPLDSVVHHWSLVAVFVFILVKLIPEPQGQ
jgi:hypothetical protein